MTTDEKPSLPRWRSHKEVEADRIIGIKYLPDPVFVLDSGARIHIGPEPFGRIAHMAATSTKHAGPIGGYYLRYADGFESWSPAEAFEAGYTAILHSDVTIQPQGTEA